MKNLFGRFVREEDGQDLVEYAFLITFIALALTVSLDYFAEELDDLYRAIGDTVNVGAPGGTTPGVS